jgi:hypothetical protein
MKHRQPLEAVLREMNEQKPMISVILRLCRIPIEDAYVLLHIALVEWFEKGTAPGELLAYVGERCLVYSGETHSSLAELMIEAGEVRGRPHKRS